MNTDEEEKRRGRKFVPSAKFTDFETFTRAKFSISLPFLPHQSRIGGMPAIGLTTLPPELIIQILREAISEYDPLQPLPRQELQSTLLPLARLSRSFQHPAQALLHRTLGFSDAVTGRDFLDSEMGGEFVTETLLLYGAGLIESTGITAGTAERIIRKTNGLRYLRLAFIGKLEEGILGLPQLADLTTLELMTAILPSPSPVVLPNRLTSLSLSTWKSPPLFVPTLLRASASTLRSLSISLSSSTPDLPEILTAFQLIAPNLTALDLTNLSALPAEFPPLLTLCRSLISLKHLTGSRIEEIHTLLSSLPPSSHLRKLSSKIFVRDMSAAAISRLDDCLELDSMRGLRKWDFAYSGEVVVGTDVGGFYGRCKERGIEVVFGY